MANLLKPSGINIIWALTGTKTDPGASKSGTGWVVELPPYQTANWIEFKQDSWIAHANQHGIPEWDSVTEYQGNLSYVQGSDGIVYKCLVTNINFDPSNPLNNTQWVRAFEPFGSVAVVSADLATHIANYQTLAAIGNTAAARTNLSVFSKTESDGRFAALAGSATQTFSVATATAASHAVPLSQLQASLVQATEAVSGIAAIASNAEVAAATIDTKIVTPLKLGTLYLSKAGNLAGLGNTATARTNLGLGSIATEASTGFLRTTNNLSDLASATVARANLGLTSTATQPETYFLRTANNLSDVVASTARTNLGLTSTATTALSSLMLKSENLSGLANNTTARANLGLGSMAVETATNYLDKAGNLAGLGNQQAARNNLGLQSLATFNALGVNAAGVAGSFLNFQSLATTEGHMTLPNGIIVQWGRVSNIAKDATAVGPFNFPTPFPTNVFVCFGGKVSPSPITGDGNVAGVYHISNSQFRAYNDDVTNLANVHWVAIGN